MTTAAERMAVFEALVETFDEIVPLLPGGVCRIGEGYRVHICPSVPFELFCGIWLTDPARDGMLAEALPGLVAEVEAAGVPVSVFLESEGYEVTPRIARSIGLTERSVQETMALGAAGLVDEPATRSAVSIEEARDADALRVALRVAAAGFEAPEDVLAPLYEPSFVAHPGATVYVGTVDGAPVSTGVGYLAGRAVGVYSVATPPEHRRRGYAGEIVRRIVSDGFRGSAATAYLLASPEGAGVYQRAGFRRVGSYDLLARPMR